MDLRSVVLGGKLRAALAVVVLLVASVGGAFALGVFGAPGVESVQNRFGGVNESTTVIETDLVVNNPNPIGVRLGGTTVNYTVRMNDVRMASGRKEGLRLSKGNTTLPFTTYMNNDRIPPWWVSHVENGEQTTVVIDAKVHTSLLGGRTFEFPQERNVSTNIIGQFNSNETRPINGSVPLYDNPLLYLNRTRGQWGDPTSQQTPIGTNFTLYNPKTKPYVVSRIGYNVTMNDVAVGSGSTESGVTIPGHTTKTVAATTVLNNQKLDDWWVTHLQND
ncbi:MAG: LEA type 2 family protein [Haloarculaceae archaeon]